MVLEISVQFPFTSRRWTLPVWCALLSSGRTQSRRRTSAQDSFQPGPAIDGRTDSLASPVTIRVLGDGGYASHELNSFYHHHQRHATLISRYHGDANLYAAPPPAKKRNGRTRGKGRKLPQPQQAIARW